MWLLRASSDQGEQRICEPYRVKPIDLKDLSQSSCDDCLIVDYKDSPYGKEVPRLLECPGEGSLPRSLLPQSEFSLSGIEAPNNAILSHAGRSRAMTLTINAIQTFLALGFGYHTLVLAEAFLRCSARGQRGVAADQEAARANPGSQPQDRDAACSTGGLRSHRP
jgi:hypothetical protein